MPREGPPPSTPAPNLPTNIIPTKLRRLKLWRKFPTDTRVPPLEIQILLEPNPLQSRILVWRLAVDPKPFNNKHHSKLTIIWRNKTTRDNPTAWSPHGEMRGETLGQTPRPELIRAVLSNDKRLSP